MVSSYPISRQDIFVVAISNKGYPTGQIFDRQNYSSCKIFVIKPEISHFAKNLGNFGSKTGESFERETIWRAQFS